MSDAPEFWWQKPGLATWLLSPMSFVYGHVAARRMMQRPGYRASVPVFCVGNLITGGAGKTPTAIAIAKAAKRAGHRPGFLSRGYGGHIKMPAMVEPDKHNAHDVGDEPLLLAGFFPTVVSPDRAKGAGLLEEAGIDFIIMDDGFQNPGLAKDYSLVVVNSKRGIGNGYCVPAGPLRATLGTQLSAASALLVIGPDSGAEKVVRQAARRARPVYEANVVPRDPKPLKGQRFLAYAAIADPEKFYKSLEAAGAKVVNWRNFPDHHPFTADECQELLDGAAEEKIVLATTTKDAARLKGAGALQEKLLSASMVLDVELRFENPRDLELMITHTIETFHRNRT